MNTLSMTAYMQLPKRKPGKYAIPQFDPVISQQKYDQLERKLKRLYDERPIVAKEMASAAEMGDFSENADYQHAKRRIRSINSQITKIEYQLDHCEIIDTARTDAVAVGHLVTVEVNGKQKDLRILGSSETNPSTGVISHQSPIGKALLGKQIDDVVTVTIGDRDISYTIIAISE